MAAGKASALYRPGTTPVHRLPGEVKIVASVAFTLLVVATPREAIWAFVVYGALLAVVAAIARIGPIWLLGRSLIELPFVLLALALPFVSDGPSFTLWGMNLSVEGSYGAWNILAKATLGVWASLLLAATTEVTALLAGLDRLRCPAVITQIASFMVRYVHVLADEARRMRLARLSRGDDPRFLWQAKAFAAGIGALFVRSFARGERVYVAMLARGYTGRMPLGAALPAARGSDWAAAAVLPVLAAAVTVTAILR